MAVSDPLVMPLARQLLDCFDTELDKVPFPPLDVQLRPGAAPYADISQLRNECCEGLGWVRIDSFYPSSTAFPAQDEAPPAKGGTSAWAITFELGVFRCAPTPGENDITSGAQWDDLVQQQMDDAAAMRRAICCLEVALRGRQRVLPGIWTPLDIQGGCAGGFMPVTVRALAPCDCEGAGDVS
jgi:hypothetical protein